MSVRRPFLKTGNTLATLNLSGTTPVAKDALNIVSKGFDITVFKSSSRIEELFPDFQFPLRNNVKISEHAQNFNVFKPRLVYR